MERGRARRSREPEDRNQKHQNQKNQKTKPNQPAMLASPILFGVLVFLVLVFLVLVAGFGTVFKGRSQGPLLPGASLSLTETESLDLHLSQHLCQYAH